MSSPKGVPTVAGGDRNTPTQRVARRSDKVSCVVVANLPPPVNGMTNVSKHMVDVLSKRFSMTVYGVSDTGSRGGWRWRISKLRQSLFAPLWLLTRGTGQNRLLYNVSNSGYGILYNVALALVARLLGYRMVLHHHSYAYVNQYDWRMGWLVRAMGPRGWHVVLCEDMASGFRQQYSAAQTVTALTNLFAYSAAAQQEPDTTCGTADFVLGYLSNITLDKGFQGAIDCVRELRQRGRLVRLLVAGPFDDPAAKRAFDSARAADTQAFEHCGPVYGAQKDAFLQKINAMIFPTRYRHEAQPLVLVEAMLAGRPVLATCRGCIRGLLNGNCGGFCTAENDFQTRAVSQIEQWIDDRASYQTACLAARRHAMQLLQESNGQLDQLLDQLEQTALQR